MSKKYTRSDLILDVFAAHEGVSKATVESIIKTALATVADHVRSGRSVELKGFATFKPVDRPAHIGRNPQTGAPINVPAKKACNAKATFKMDHAAD